MGRKIPGAALLAAAALAAALPCEAAYVRGDLVWKCDFTPEEAARCGVAGLRFDESGRGAEYDPRGGAAGDGALEHALGEEEHEERDGEHDDGERECGAEQAVLDALDAEVPGLAEGHDVLPAHVDVPDGFRRGAHGGMLNAEC